MPRTGFLLIASLFFGEAGWGQPVLLDRTVTLVLDDREPGAVWKAAADLAEDCESVFGARPRVVGRWAEASGTAILISSRGDLPSGIERPAEAETFRIALVEGPRRAVVLAGADGRGTIYAIYEFSHRFFGVDPLHFWTDHEPAKQATIRVPAETNVVSPRPRFRYRGWFINDEDLLTGWKPVRKDSTGIALEAWDHVFEALLRLRGNMIVPGTFIFPDEPQVRAASERGLIITQHHIEVLGTNTWRWPSEAPYSFSRQPELLIRAWRNAVRQYTPGQEVIWTVGYRGRHDRPFWEDDPDIPATDSARAQAIRSAIDQQLAIVRAERKQPYFLMNAWMEAVPLIRKGLLRLPEGVTLVWPDNGHGIIRDEGTIAKGQGVYYHTAMHNALANQLTEMVPLERIERELGRASRAEATEYLLVNVSDVRPYPLTTQAVMEIAWQGHEWSAGEYLNRWCGEQFGAAAAAELAAYYRAYFAAPGRYGAAEHQTLADNAYHNFLRLLLVGMMQGETTIAEALKRRPSWVPALDLATARRYTSEAAPRWAAARAHAERAAPKVPADRQPFFQAHVRTQLDIHEYSNSALHRIAEAWADRAAAAEHVTGAVADLRRVRQAMEAAETGKWKGFYAEDRFVDVRKSIALAEAAVAKIAGRPLPEGLVLQPFVVDPYFWLKEYQKDRWVDVRP